MIEFKKQALPKLGILVRYLPPKMLSVAQGNFIDKKSYFLNN